MEEDNSFLSLDIQTIDFVTGIFSALSDPTRFKLMYMLLQRECTVQQINEVLPISQAAISQQLKRLRLQGLVRYQKEGQYHIYSYTNEHVMRLFTEAIRIAEKKEPIQ
ncbi:ArsR/SmtB family transcription factor [Paenibacillus sp. GXUN7292]|uniref:ArsR/SmtB family transcription factor n=1 Tax=Paenibacillus sp. GXUN7292 TaxID=3422499 RepID=UPI003D7EFD26